MTPAKPGYRTTEFWVLVAATIGEITAAAAGVIPGKTAALFLTISAVAYKISRGLAKVK